MIREARSDELQQFKPATEFDDPAKEESIWTSPFPIDNIEDF